MDGTKYVVVGEEMVESEKLDGPRKPPNRVGIASKLVLRVHGANAHGFSLSDARCGATPDLVLPGLIKAGSIDLRQAIIELGNGLSHHHPDFLAYRHELRAPRSYVALPSSRGIAPASTSVS